MQKKKITDTRNVPVFPLPNVVFFPKTLLPLHVFEARYRKMVHDALQGNSLVAIALLKDGWEKNYFGEPEVHEIACVGKIQQTEKLDDGKFNIMLYGMRRARIIDFVQSEPYRVASVRYIRDLAFDRDRFDERHETEQFIDTLRAYLVGMGAKNLEELLRLQTHSLESIVNQVASILDFTVAEKQELLETDSLQERYERVLELVHDRILSMRIARNIRVVPEDPSWN